MAAQAAAARYTTTPVRFIWDIRSSGYASVLRNGGTTVRGSSITQFASTGTIAPVAGSLKLPIQDTPEPHVEPVEDWVSISEFGARAFDSDGETDYGRRHEGDSARH
jgi:hypothetical protein